MPNIYRLIGLYHSHVKFTICSLPFVFEHLYAYLEPQLTNSRNSHFDLIFPGFYKKQKKLDPFFTFLIGLNIFLFGNIYRYKDNTHIYK